METERLSAAGYQLGVLGRTYRTSGVTEVWKNKQQQIADSSTRLPQLVDHLRRWRDPPKLESEGLSSRGVRSGMYEKSASEMMVVR